MISSEAPSRSSNPRLKTFFACSAFIVLYFGALALAPKLFQKRHHILNVNSAKANEQRIPLEVSVLSLNPGGQKLRKPLRDFLEKNRKFHIINFWASWCPPCVEELPSLEYLARQLHAQQDLLSPSVLAISVDEDIEPIQALFKTLDFSPSFGLYLDQARDLARSLGITRFPETFLIDDKGTVLRKWIGPQNWLSDEILGFIAHNSSRHH